MKIYISRVLLISCVFFAFNACNNINDRSSKDIDKQTEIVLDSSNRIFVVEDALFSLPSPYHISSLLENEGVGFNPELLNPSDNYNKYSTRFKKAVNLGIYGADLAYLNTYQQTPSAITYFSAIKSLSAELGLSSAFSSSVFTRIENNVHNRDSLLVILSSTFRQVDYFLKENQRQGEGAMLLAGGWIESMYIISNLAIENDKETLKTKIGENIQPLINLIKILSPFSNESNEVSVLKSQLEGLLKQFNEITITYKFVEPDVDELNSITYVNSESNISVSLEQIKSIKNNIEEIRASLIN